MVGITRYMWALVALVFVMVFGGFVPDASAKSLTEVRACVDQSFTAAPFKGTLPQKERQARHLPALTTTVTVDGMMIKLPQGSSVWKLCEGPSALDVANQQILDLKAANGRLQTEATRLEGLAYETIETRYTATGFVAKGTTWKDRAADLAGELDTAKANATSAGNWLWFFGILAGLAILTGLWTYGKLRRTKDQLDLAQKRFEQQMRPKPVEPSAPTPPQGDADLAAPAPPAPAAGEPPIPAFAARTRPAGT